MERKKYIIVANWKMLLSYHESVTFCSINYEELKKIATTQQLILCPPFVALSAIQPILKETNIFLGAQDCSVFTEGTHTGEISATMLHEVGCTYCIIGHQERRNEQQETDAIIFQKIQNLLTANITPILCVGEKKQDTIANIKKTIEQQLQRTVENKQKHNNPFYIAYEPAWAISKKTIPEISIIQEIIDHIHIYCQGRPIKILYGGSVDQDTITALTAIEKLDGFLIGSASSNFKTLSKTVSKL